MNREYFSDDAAWRIGEWTVEPSLHQLRKGEESLRLSHKQMAVLLRLAAQPGQCVRREVLIDEVWERQVINDEVLSRTVAELRRALNDQARTPQYIETIPKRGYRLLAPVSRLVSDPAVIPIETAMHEGVTPAVDPQDLDRTPAADPAARPFRRGAVVAGLAAVALLSVLLLAAGQWSPRSLPARPAPSASGVPAEIATSLQPQVLAAQPLTGEGVLAVTPRWSRDGLQLFYARAHAGATGRADLLRQDLDRSTPTTLVADGHLNVCPSPAPDGQALAWLRNDPKRCQVMYTKHPGAEPEMLGECLRIHAQHSCPEFSADGTTLYFSGPARDGVARIVALDLPTRTRRPATRPPPTGGLDQWPRLSPDGRWLAFNRGLADGRGQVHVQSLDSGELRTLQDEAQTNAGHTWLEHGDALLIATDEPGFPALVTRGLDGSTFELLGARGARMPDRSATGALAWESVLHTVNLWLHGDPAVRAPNRLTESRGCDHHPALDHAGHRLALTSTRAGQRTIRLLDLERGDEQRLPLPRDSEWSHPRWTPDDRGLWVTRSARDSRQVCLLWLDEARLECPEALIGAEDGGALADGRLAFVRTAEDGRRLLWLWDPADGSSREWSQRPVQAWRTSGELLAVQEPGDARVQAYRIDDDSDVPLYTAEVGPVGSPWALSGHSLVWVDSRPPVAQLREQPLLPGWTAPPRGQLDLLANEISVSRSGDRLVIGHSVDPRVEVMWSPEIR